MLIELPELPYPADALEPRISARTLSTHHDKHHRAHHGRLAAPFELCREETVAGHA